MNIEEAITDYLLDIEIRKYSPRTIQSYKQKLKRLTIFCKEIGVDDMDDLTMSHVKQFSQKMIQKGNKGSYINSCLKTIKSFIQYCYEEDMGGFNTKRKSFKWVKEEKAVIRAFDSRDVRYILNSCKGNDFLHIRDAAMLTMFFETGIRCLELCSIKEEDIRDGFILINGKGNKQRAVPITPILRKALSRYDRVRAEYFRDKRTDNFYFLSSSGRKIGRAHV